jgi:biopolymer transport protein ExbD
MFIKVGPTRKYQEVIEAIDIARGAGVQVIGLTPPQEAQQ